MVEVKKKELEKIWNWLRQSITLEEAEWLMRKRPGMFLEERPPLNSQEARKMIMEGIYDDELVDSNVFNLIYIIQDVLDANRGTDTFRSFTKNLPREYVDQLGRKAGIDVSRLSGRDALEMILEKL